MIVKTAYEIINWFREEGLPIYIIAQIANNDFERLSKIYHLLNEQKQSDLRNLYRLWNRKVNDNSLANLFSQARLDDISIRQTLNQLWPEAKRYMDWNNKNVLGKNTKTNPILNEMNEFHVFLHKK